jgi:hypothetical protein
MVFREVGALIVSVHSAEAPTDEDWSAYLQLCRRKMARERLGALAVTAGGGPNSKQRAALQELLRGGPVPGAVVTDSAVVRGIVTALGWFNPGIRAFGFNVGAGLYDALRHLGVEGPAAERVVVEVRAMQRALDVGGAR